MKPYYLLILTLLLSLHMVANTGDEDTKKPVSEKTTTAPLPPVMMRRSFANLDAKIEKDIKQLVKKATVKEFAPDELYTRFESDTVANNLRTKAKSVIDTLVAGNKFLESLTDYITGETPVTLPIGIKKEIGSSEFIMGVSQIKIGKDYSELEIFVRIRLPQYDKTGKRRELFFGASRVKLSHKGGLFGDADLVLLGDVGIPFQGKNILMILKGGFDLKTGDLKKKTYVTIDCDGFKELGLAADVEFSRKKILPVKADNTIDNSTIGTTKILKKVTTSFEVVTTGWNDILVEISLPRFQVPKLKNTIFELNTAIFDFSDTRNSPNMQWPTDDYQQTYLIPGEEDLWRGVYVASLTVVLPKQFQRKGSDKRISFGAEKMLIDNNGVSGTFKAENILPLDTGNADGWQFSVDRIQLSFVAGDLSGAGFGGAMVLPVTTETVSGTHTEKYIDKNGKEQSRLTIAYESSDTTVLIYNALIDPVNEEYVLNASPENDIAFDIFKAKATLTKNSYIELRLSKGKFRPKALLHGNMAIKGSNSGSTSATATADFEGITFQDFQLQTISPIIKIGHAGYTGEVKVGNFPVTISEIGIRAKDNIAALDFTIAINLMDNAGFSGNASLSIEGDLKQGDGFEKWKFKRIKLRRVEIAADMGFKIEGFVEFRDDDPVYGDGFAGMVKATFTGGIAVTISAAFGKTDYRYWYIDGLVEGLSIPIPPVFAITGFGGGASYRMKKEGFSSNIGIGSSGLNYVPDRDSGLTVKAMMLFSITKGESLINGGFGFEMAFNRHGGINRVSLYGEAHLLQIPGFEDAGDEISENFGGIVENESGMPDAVENQLKETDLIGASKAIYPAVMEGQKGLNAYMAIEFDFTAKTFHGTFELYIDVLGGVFKGVGPGGRAAWAVIHFGPGEWYVHIGTPTDPIGIKIGIGSVALTSKSYFMMGDYMPPSPPPPAQVAEILGLDAEVLDYMRDENALAGGRGVAFGASLEFDTGDMNFFMFYARFNAGFGFDIMVKDYGDAMCKGSGQIGVNGWYANGQSYVYLQGSMGINFKLFGKRRRIPIIEAGAATLMQAKLPNPVWFRGYLGGYYRLLGGLVKGNFRFEMQFGKECELISGGSPLGDIKIIADISPRDKINEVDVFAVPQVAFNMQIGSPIKVEDEEYKIHYYRFKLDDFWIKDDKGSIVLGEQALNNNNDLLSFTSNEILPPKTTMNLYVSVTFEEKVNGKWIPVVYNGELLKEEENTTFTTGTAPDYIPETNIAYSYPVIGQKYFFPKEYNKGYIKLKRGQAYLFNLDAGWSQRSYFTDEYDMAIESSLSYNAGDKKVMIPLPEIENTKEYTLKLLTLPPSATSSTVKEKYTTAGDGENTVEIKNVSIDGLTTNPETIEMLSYVFNTSKFDSFSEKIKGKKYRNTFRETLTMRIHKLRMVVKNSEPFDEVDLAGNQYTEQKPLIRAEAVLDDNYYKNEIYPLIYKGYPLKPEFTVDRDESILGIPPTKGMDELTWYQTYLEAAPDSHFLKERMPYSYNLPYYYHEDFIDIVYNIVNANLTNPNPKYDYIINAQFPHIKKGKYPARYQYVLPGGITGTSSNVNYINPD
ncbi:hypothetical protein ATE84_1326 [Aquimarina sp. MAR_2010_214]|uniref:hypothetical protein n=1 Tax=Aquimarina sp. MAR_2010_214 TaxID=1250026 RepID=UPI000CBFCDD8|nr:hypothetical protein [Aquimarina sp. MAR_2010_214]PKV49305.1 hypothetical protein ATE84_1326 [Aquimarina sp. MAR_2010_214]